jgi:CxxC motif-containing protein
VKNQEYNFSNNPTFTTGSEGDLAEPTMIGDPKTYITTVGLYNTNKELLATAKTSKPIQKSFTKEILLKIKLDF